MREKPISIAIDGPSGAGKSTLARLAAERFGFLYVDTGAIYRTVGLAVQRAGLDARDAAGIEALLPELEIDLRYDSSGKQRMYLGGEDVSEEIRTPKSSRYASDVSALPAVRAFLLDMQREFARRKNVIMDGRDIGTVVLPDADLKIFLTASSRDRAQRRLEELHARGDTSTFAEVLSEIERRDENDSSRAAAPLRAAEDAVVLDTSGNTLAQSAELLCGVIKERLHL